MTGSPNPSKGSEYSSNKHSGISIPLKPSYASASDTMGSDTLNSNNDDRRLFVRLNEPEGSPWKDTMTSHTTSVGSGEPTDVLLQTEDRTISQKGTWLPGTLSGARAESNSGDLHGTQSKLHDHPNSINVRNDVDIRWTAIDAV